MEGTEEACPAEITSSCPYRAPLANDMVIPDGSSESATQTTKVAHSAQSVASEDFLKKDMRLAVALC
jgi:hypothetical protein